MYQSEFRKPRKNRVAKLLKKLLIITVAVLPLLILGSWMWFQSLLSAPGDGSRIEIIEISEGVTQDTVASQLEASNIIKSALAYRVQARLSGSELIAGRYEVNDGQSVRSLQDLFSEGLVTTKLVTILPASRLSQIRQNFIDEGYSQSEVDEALKVSNYLDHPALESLPPEGTLEGYLYPESFLVDDGTPLESVIRLSLDQMALLLTPERKAGIRSQGLTVHEGIILSSIIEEEVSNLDDKPIVAQVFLKRLKEGIPLGSDPTARYGASLIGVDETVFAETPYNTRTNLGLPPSPISNTSASSLDAVIKPSNTEYLYFVSGDDGITRFSFTLEEHEQKAREFCVELCQL